MKILVIVFMIFFGSVLDAQYLNVETSLKTGSGLKATNLNGEVGYQRSFFYLMTDNSFITDEDRSFQYGFSIDLTFERKISFTPGIFWKLEKEVYNNLLIFGLIGVTYMIIPDTVFGLRMGSGLNYGISKDFGFIFEIDIEPFLFGSGLNDRVMAEINFLIGVGFLF